METVGRVYMAASGAPDKNENHAQNIADVSLQLIEHVRSLKLPSGIDIRIRIGNHDDSFRECSFSSFGCFGKTFSLFFYPTIQTSYSSLILRTRIVKMAEYLLECRRNSLGTGCRRCGRYQGTEVLFLR